jgi:hypothetical protein
MWRGIVVLLLGLVAAAPNITAVGVASGNSPDVTHGLRIEVSGCPSTGCGVAASSAKYVRLKETDTDKNAGRASCADMVIVGEKTEEAEAVELDPDRTSVTFYVFAALPAPGTKTTTYSLSFDSGCFCSTNCDGASTDEQTEMTDFASVFTTGSNTDTTSPQLLLASPSAGAYASDSGEQPVVLYFSEPVGASTVGTGRITMDAADWNGPDAVASVTLDVGSDVEFSEDGTSATLLSGKLTAARSYSLKVGPGVFEDKNGNVFQGVTGAGKYEDCLSVPSTDCTECAIRWVVPTVIATFAPAGDQVLPYMPVMLTFRDPVNVSASVGTALYATGMAASIVVERKEGSVWVVDDSTWVVGSAADLGFLEQSASSTQFLLLPKRFQAGTRYRVTVPRAAFLYAEHAQFTFTTQSTWEQLGTGVRCDAEALTNFRTGRTACEALCDQAAQCKYFEADGTYCIQFAEDAACETNQVKPNPDLYWDDDSWVLMKKILSDTESPKEVFRAYDDPAPPAVGVSAQTVLRMTFSERVTPLKGKIMLWPHNPAMRARPVLKCGEYWSDKSYHRNLPYLGPCSLDVEQSKDSWRLGYVTMSKGVTAEVHFGSATLIPGQTYDVEFPEGLFRDAGNLPSHGFVEVLRVGNVLSDSALYPAAAVPLYPAVGQTMVPPTTALRLRFEGKPHPGTGPITFTAHDGETFTVPTDDPAQVAFVGNDVVIDPQPNLVDSISGGKTWAVEIGSAIENFKMPAGWTFTTAWSDDSPPQLIEVFPPNGGSIGAQDAVGADGTTQILLRFDEQVQRGSEVAETCIITLLHESGTKANSFEFDVTKDTESGSVGGLDPLDPRRLVLLRPKVRDTGASARLIAGLWELTIPSDCVKDQALFTGVPPNSLVANETVALTVGNTVVVRFAIDADDQVPMVRKITPASGTNFVPSPLAVRIDFQKDIRVDRSKEVHLRSTLEDFTDDRLDLTIALSDRTKCQFSWDDSATNATKIVYFYFDLTLTGGRKYYLDIEHGAIKDAANNWYIAQSNPYQEYGYWFVTSAVTETTIPSFEYSKFLPAACSVSGSACESGGVGHSRTNNILVYFDEPMLHSTTGASVDITGSGAIDASASAGNVILASDQMSALILNPNDLSTGDNYLLVEDGAFIDLSAAQNSVPEVSSALSVSNLLGLYGFSVVSANADTQPPTVYMVCPGGPVGGFQQATASPNGGIVLYFSEEVSIITSDPSASIRITDCGPSESPDCASGTEIVIASDSSSGGTVVRDSTEFSIVTVTPTAGSLTAKHYYQLSIDASVFEDTALIPNAMGALSAFFSWNTAEGVAPTLLSTTPAAGETGLPRTGQFILWFDEEMMVASGAVTIGGASATVTCMAFACEVLADATLDTFTSYEVSVPEGAITDLVGNSPSAISVAVTTLGTDIASPSVLFFSPAVNMTEKRLTTGSFKFEVVVSEPVRFFDKTYEKMAEDAVCSLVDCGDDLDCTTGQDGDAQYVGCAITKQTIEVQTGIGLARDRAYHLHIDAGLVVDLFGNAMGIVRGYNFTTVSADSHGPGLLRTTSIPSGNNGVVFTSDHLLLRFDNVTTIAQGTGALTVMWCGDDCACGSADDSVHEVVPMDPTADNVAFGTERVWVDLAEDLVPGGRYYLSAPADTWRDENGAPSRAVGLGSGEIQFDFTVDRATVDITAPVMDADAIVMTVGGVGIPSNDAGMGVKDVSVNQDIKVYFTEPVKFTDDTTQILFRYIQGGASVSNQQTTSGDDSVTMSDSGVISIALPYQTGLSNGATYGIQFGNSLLQDTEKMQLVSSDTSLMESTSFFRFTLAPNELGSTEATAPVLDSDGGDATVPDSTKVFPAPGASDVPVDVMFKLTLTEDENPIIIDIGYDIKLKAYKHDCTTEVPDADRTVDLASLDGSTVINDGANTLFFQPSAQLVDGICYQVVIPAGAITDSASPVNSFAGIGQGTDPTDWYFSTVATGGDVAVFDFTPPAAGDPLHFLPLAGAGDISTGTPITLVFSEPVQGGVEPLFLVGRRGGAVVDNVTIDVADSQQVRFRSDSVDIYSPRLLQAAATYTITFPVNCIVDMNLNSFIPSDGPLATYSFTTVYQDDQPPTLLSVSPQPVNEHIPTYVSAGPAIVLFLSEDVRVPTAGVSWQVKDRQTQEVVQTVLGAANASTAFLLAASPHGIGNRSSVTTATASGDLLSQSDVVLQRNESEVRATVMDPTGFVQIAGSKVTFTLNALPDAVAGVELQLGATGDNILIDATAGLNGMGLAAAELEPYVFEFRQLQFYATEEHVGLSFPLYDRRLDEYASSEEVVQELDLLYAGGVAFNGTVGLLGGRRASIARRLQAVNTGLDNVSIGIATTTTSTTAPPLYADVSDEMCVLHSTRREWSCAHTEGLGHRYRVSLGKTDGFFVAVGGYDWYGDPSKTIHYSADGLTWEDKSPHFISLPFRVTESSAERRNGVVPHFAAPGPAGVGACVGVVQGWTIVVCGGGMVNCWHTADEEGLIWQEGTTPLHPAVQDRNYCSLLERSDGGLVLMGGTNAAGVPYEDVWVSYDYGDHFRQLTAKLAPGFTAQVDASYALMHDDTLAVIGGNVAEPSAEVWTSMPGLIDLPGFDSSLPTVTPSLRTTFPESGTIFRVVNASAGVPLSGTTLRSFEVYLVFTEEMIAAAGSISVGSRIVCRPKFMTCVDLLSTVYPIPPLETVTIAVQKGYVALLLDADYLEPGAVVITVAQDAVQDLYGNPLDGEIVVTYTLEYESTPTEVIMDELVPAPGASNLDLVVLHVPFTKAVDLNRSNTALSISPLVPFKSSVSFDSPSIVAQLSETVLEIRWPDEVPYLSPGMQYEVNLSGVVDTDGFYMVPASWRFTVRDGWAERAGVQHKYETKYTFPEQWSEYTDDETMADVLEVLVKAQRLQQEKEVADRADNITLQAELVELENENPELKAALEDQEEVVNVLAASLDANCTFPTTYMSGGQTVKYKMYPPYPFPLTIEYAESYDTQELQEVEKEYTTEVETYEDCDPAEKSNPNCTVVMVEEVTTYTVEEMVDVTKIRDINVSCLCYGENDPDFVAWTGYVYSWFNFVSCKDSSYYAACSGIMPTLSSTCKELLDDYADATATYDELDEEYNKDSKRKKTVEATLDKMTYTGDPGPPFARGWPDNGATDVAGDWDIILIYDEPVDLAAEGSIIVRSSARGVVKVFDTATSPYVVIVPQATVYWIVIRMAKALEDGDITVSGGLSALGTVSVEIDPGVVVDTSQHYEPSAGIAAGEYSFTVMTLPEDTTAPFVVATAPTEGETVLGSLEKITVQLSEAVRLTAGFLNSVVELTSESGSGAMTIATGNGTTTILDLLVPKGLLAQADGMATWSFTLPSGWAVDGALAQNEVAAFTLTFQVDRSAAPGLQSVAGAAENLPVSATLVLEFPAEMSPGEGILTIAAAHPHNTFDFPIEDAAIAVLQEGKYLYRSASGLSPLETSLTFAGRMLFVAPQAGFPAGEELAVVPPAAGTFRNAAGQPSVETATTAAFSTAPMMRFAPTTSAPSGVAGGIAVVTEANELLLAAGVSEDGPISGVVIGATGRKINCRVGVSAFSACRDPCSGEQRSVMERIVREPSPDGQICVDTTGRAHASRLSFDKLPASVASKEFACVCPVCVQGPRDFELPPNADLANPEWETWKSISSGDVFVPFPCAPGYSQEKDFLCSVGDIAKDRYFEFYGKWSIAPGACVPKNCTDESLLPIARKGSQLDCTASFKEDGQMMHGESCDVFCEAGWEPVPRTDGYIKANGELASDRELLCEFGVFAYTPVCTQKRCSPTPEERPQWTPEGGTMTCKPGKGGEHTLGTTCRIECFPGFEPEGAFNGPSKCTYQAYNANKPEAGVKYLTPLSCPRQSCGPIKELKKGWFHATVNCSRGDNAFEDECVTVCDDGYELKNPADPTIKCLLPERTEDDTTTPAPEGGPVGGIVKWTGGGKEGCSARICPQQPPAGAAIPDTIVQCAEPGALLGFGEICDVRCKNNNFALAGIPSRDGYSGYLECVVQEDGSMGLNGMPTCTAKSCTAPKTVLSITALSSLRCEGLLTGGSCLVNCADGYEPTLPEFTVEDENGFDAILLTCSEGELHGAEYLRVKQVCKEAGSIVSLEKTVRSAVTLAGDVAGTYTSMRKWVAEKKVKDILRQVISDTVSTPDVYFPPDDIELSGDNRRLLARESVMMYDDDDDREEDIEGRALQSSNSAKVSFWVLMRGENAEDIDASLQVAMNSLMEAQNNSMPFLQGLNMELWQNVANGVFYPPQLSAFIAVPKIANRVTVTGMVTPAPTPPDPPPPDNTWYYLSWTAGIIVFCAGCCRCLNRRRPSKKGKDKVAPSEKDAKGEKGKGEEKGAKTGTLLIGEEPEVKPKGDVEAPEAKPEKEEVGFQAGKRITKPSEARINLDEEEDEQPVPGLEPEGEPAEGAGQVPAGEAVAAAEQPSAGPEP